MTNKTKIILITLIGIAIFCCGYYFGNKSVSSDVIYEKRDVIRDSIVREFIVDTCYLPQSIKYLTKRDTMYIEDKVYVTEKVDTVKILEDWAMVREYKTPLLNSDTIGTLTIFTRVQYNNLQKVGYEFQPVQKVIRTDRKEKSIQPYIAAGLNNQFKPVIGAGAFVGKYGISYQYQSFNEWQPLHSVMINMKF